MREYFDFYAVPLRLLWKSAPSVLTQMQDINQIQALSLAQNLSLGTYLPSLPLSSLQVALTCLNGNSNNPSVPGSGSGNLSLNMFGFYRSDLSFKLLNYLGYGNFVRVSPSSGNRWWSTSLKVSETSTYTQKYISNTVVNLPTHLYKSSSHISQISLSFTQEVS